MMKVFAAAVAAVLVTGSFALASEGVLPMPKPKTAFGESDALTEAAKHDMYCNEDQPKTVERIAITYKYDYDPATVREQGYWIVSCTAGAYNANSVLLREDTYEGVLWPVAFAEPQINKKGKIVGFTAVIVTGALSFDPKTNQLSTFSKGRGIGDMYVAGMYQLYETEVILREYTIDNIEGDDVDVKPIYKSTEPINR